MMDPMLDMRTLNDLCLALAQFQNALARAGLGSLEELHGRLVAELERTHLRPPVRRRKKALVDLIGLYCEERRDKAVVMAQVVQAVQLRTRRLKRDG